MFIQGWELRFAVLAFGRMRQEDCEFQTRLGYIRRHHLQNILLIFIPLQAKACIERAPFDVLSDVRTEDREHLCYSLYHCLFSLYPHPGGHSPASHCCWKADIASMVQKERRAVYCWWFLSVASIRPFNQVTEEENYSFLSLIVIVCYPSTSLIRWWTFWQVPGYLVLQTPSQHLI